METGQVKFYNHFRGFGFIYRCGNPDVFFHFGGLIDVVKDGDEVEFETKTVPNGGLLAFNIKKSVVAE